MSESVPKSGDRNASDDHDEDRDSDKPRPRTSKESRQRLHVAPGYHIAARMSFGFGESRGGGKWLALEIVTAFVVSIAFVASCTIINVNALTRPGQVSALAAIDYRLMWFGIPLVAALAISAKVRGGAGFDRVSALVCAAFAGLASAGLAGGIVAILHRTNFALGAYLGDTAVLADWSDRLKHGAEIPGKIVGAGIYPPMQVYWVAWISKLFSFDSLYAVKYFQILGVVLLGPLSYATWRLLLRPTWALGLGVVCTLPLVEAFREYPMLVLVIFLPLLVKFFDVYRRSPDYHPLQLARFGVLFGNAFGLLFLMYSGWVQWSAPGILFAGLYFLPWRKRPSHALILAGVTALLFAIVSIHYLISVAHAPPIRDDYTYFETSIDPAYFAMWRGGMPGKMTFLTWPPPGELGNVGMFTVLICVGIGAAIALGPRRTLVISLSAILAGTWLFRFYYAHRYYETKLVQLYPRTTVELLYGSMILAGYAVYMLVERARARAAPDSPLRGRAAVVGLAAGLLLLIVQSTSVTTDRYMPEEDGDYWGHLAWLALKTPQLEDDQAAGAKVTTVGETSDDPNHEESIEVHLPTVRGFASAVLYPAPDGFPIDFELDVWDSQHWLTRLKVTNQAAPDKPLVLRWTPPDPDHAVDYTNAFRIRATKLRRVGNGYGLRMAKIELFP
jgi:galactan 5-O-arabinofuranosyltransferase